MNSLQHCMDRLLAEGAIGHAAVRVGTAEGVLLEAYAVESDRRALFDLESLTKILCTATLAMVAMDRGLLRESDPVERYFPVGEDRKEMTVGHLLTHTSGLRNRTLLSVPGTKHTAYAYLAEKSGLQYPVGTDLRLSNRGYVLLGGILEKVLGCPLSVAFRRYVAEPLGMSDATGFLPRDRSRVIPSQADPMLLGRPADGNVRFLGGVAGNGGLFGCADDLCLYAEMILRGGAPLLSEEVLRRGMSDLTPDKRESRGYGFLRIDESHGPTAGLFGPGSVGHTAITGQSLFIDPAGGFYALVLTDATYGVERKRGIPNLAEAAEIRRTIHTAIAETGIVGTESKK